MGTGRLVPSPPLPIAIPSYRVGAMAEKGDALAPGGYPKFGPSMVVTRKGKDRLQKGNEFQQDSGQGRQGQQSNYGKDSHFAVLANFEEGDSNNATNIEPTNPSSNKQGPAKYNLRVETKQKKQALKTIKLGMAKILTGTGTLRDFLHSGSVCG